VKVIEQRLPKDFDKSFIVFEEVGQFFPCPWHFHPEYEIVLVTKSFGRRMVGDHIGYFEEGDIVFMGPYLPHVWVNDPLYASGQADHLAEAIVVQFEKNFLGEKFMELPEVSELNHLLYLSERGLVIKGKAREKVSSLMKTMPGLNGLQRLSILFSIFDVLNRNKEYELLTNPGFVQNFEFKSSEKFKKVTEYIMMNFDEEIQLHDIATIANMAVTTFCNFFKTQFRMTFIEYLNVIRVGHACKLLAQKENTIVDIAYRCGYQNIANFNRQFKKLKNMTPREYRNTLEDY
jgi:AraC-like DNA-binding protein